MKENKGKKVWWYTWRSALLLVYVIGGLFGFSSMILWNHGFFGDGANVIPTSVEFGLFVLWIIVGIVGLFLISKKNIKQSLLVVLIAIIAVIIFCFERYMSTNAIPDMNAGKKVNTIQENAEDFCDVPIDYRYITFYLDVDANELHYWNHSDEKARHYDTITTFSAKEVDEEFSELEENLVMYKLKSENGEIYFLSGPKYYREIEEIYWLYDGQMYYADVENVIWNGNEEECWKKGKEEYYK